MSEMKATAIPARIKHLGVCAHPQTPAARRACRKAMIAALAATPAPAPVEYRGGETFEVNGVEVILCKSGFNRRTRWTWFSEQLQVAGEATQETPEAAIANAHRALARRCSCGQPATLTASTGPACVACYDRKAA
ncbi:MAG TPA: hypothetical protein VHA75_20245 [Rugosimonospora sp.]|nr:hypothetical protein [Rugosimonospora sp.]